VGDPHVRIWETCFSTILRRTIRRRDVLPQMWGLPPKRLRSALSTSTPLSSDPTELNLLELPKHGHETSALRNMFRKSMVTSQWHTRASSE